MLTVRELSERSGVSEDTITKIENGHRKGRPVTLRKLAQALGVDHRELVETTRRSAEKPSVEAPKGKVYKYDPESGTYEVRSVYSWLEYYLDEEADFVSSPPLNVGNAMRLIKVWTHALHEHAENANAVLDDELVDGHLLLQQIYAIQEGARVIDTLSSQARDMLQQEVWERTDESGAPEDEHLNVALAVSKTLSKHTHDLPTIGQIETDIQGASREQIYDILSRINSTLPTRMEHTPPGEMLTEGVYEKFLEHLKSQRDN